MAELKTTISVDFKDPVSILQQAYYKDLVPWDMVIELCLFIDNLVFHIPYILQLEVNRLGKEPTDKLIEEHFRAMVMDLFHYHCDSILHELDMTDSEDLYVDRTLVYSVQLLGGWLIQYILPVIFQKFYLDNMKHTGEGSYRINLVPVNKGLMHANMYTYLFELELKDVAI
jgi:hypothetical protein|nr:MAG TPA: hypothetical protein [Caudoviricetes sp.]